jgi:phosphotriesterase-related protein
MKGRHSIPTNQLTRREAMRLLGAGLGVASAWPVGVDALAAGAQRPQAARVSFPRGAIIRTVLKDVPPDALARGATLFHEHLSLTSPYPYAPPPAKQPPPHFSTDVAMMVEEARAAGKDGVACLVDGGHADMGRSVDALRRIATESGVFIVASGGYYTDTSYPPEIETKSDDQIAETLVADAVAQRHGAFGEIGTSSEITLKERKVLRAIGKAHVRTGIPIFTHNAIYKPDAHQQAMKVAMMQLDILESTGVKPQNVVIGHICCHDDPKAEVPIAIARRGAFVGFDRVTINSILPDEKRAQMAMALVNAGHADKLLLASDFAVPANLKSKGGPGLAQTVTVFGPILKKAGASDDLLHQILVDNPRRFLAFVPKKTS